MPLYQRNITHRNARHTKRRPLYQTATQDNVYFKEKNLMIKQLEKIAC